MSAPHTSTLARYLLIAYALLLVYATLYPLSGWRDSGASPLDFLFSDFGARSDRRDAWLNFGAYLPNGFLAALCLQIGRAHV